MRGIPLNQQQLWSYSIEKENNLRLKWFKKNEARLDETANKSHLRQVPMEVKDEMRQRMLNYFGKKEEKRSAPHDDLPTMIEEKALTNIMRPVEKAVRDLLYANTIKEGRKTYLKERYKLLPEQRYYFPETSNFKYGWQMWEVIKNIKTSDFARQQVIRNSFYRRRGVVRDPEWYKEPSKLSPMICGKI